MIECGVYYPTNSFWHQRSAGEKLLLLAVGIISLCFIDLKGLLIALFCLELLMLSSKLPLRLAFRMWWRFKWLLLIVALADFCVGETAWIEQINDACLVILRLAEMLLLASWFSWTTKSLAVVKALDKIIGAKSFFRIKLDLPLMLMLILRLIPELLEESENIVLAQRARGLNPSFRLKDGRFWLQATLIPLFILGIRRAAVLAVALEARGYILGGERSAWDLLD